MESEPGCFIHGVDLCLGFGRGFTRMEEGTGWPQLFGQTRFSAGILTPMDIGSVVQGLEHPRRPCTTPALRLLAGPDTYGHFWDGAPTQPVQTGPGIWTTGAKRQGTTTQTWTGTTGPRDWQGCSTTSAQEVPVPSRRLHTPVSVPGRPPDQGSGCLWVTSVFSCSMEGHTTHEHTFGVFCHTGTPSHSSPGKLAGTSGIRQDLAGF